MVPHTHRYFAAPEPEVPMTVQHGIRLTAEQHTALRSWPKAATDRCVATGKPALPTFVQPDAALVFGWSGRAASRNVLRTLSPHGS